jgi:hypothetical protein
MNNSAKFHVPFHRDFPVKPARHARLEEAPRHFLTAPVFKQPAGEYGISPFFLKLCI